MRRAVREMLATGTLADGSREEDFQRKRDEQWFNNYSWGQHLEKDEVNQSGQE